MTEQKNISKATLTVELILFFLLSSIHESGQWTINVNDVGITYNANKNHGAMSNQSFTRSNF